MIKLQTLLVKVQADTLALVAKDNYSPKEFQEVIDRNLNLIDLSEVRESGQYLCYDIFSGYQLVNIIKSDLFSSGFGVHNWAGNVSYRDTCVTDFTVGEYKVLKLS